MSSAADYEELLVKSAENFRLDINLIKAICTVESQWNTWANRFEPGSTYSVAINSYASKLSLTYSTEEVNQHTSWGLMQVMGFLARDLGFVDNLPMLCTPEIGVFYGCKQLRRLSDKYGDETDVIAAYNAGSPRKASTGMYVNQNYVNSIHGELIKLRKLQ